MTDPESERAEIDVRVQDPAALEEIDLYSELIIVAGRSAQSLSRDQIDRALGVRDDIASANPSTARSRCQPRVASR